MSLAQWNRTLETNLTGGFLVVREFVKRLVRVKEEQGEDSEALRNVSVVFVGSTGESFEHLDGLPENKERLQWMERVKNRASGQARRTARILISLGRGVTAHPIPHHISTTSHPPYQTSSLI
jgi:hypothetical protein